MRSFIKSFSDDVLVWEKQAGLKGRDFFQKEMISIIVIEKAF
jgi:hypothetical protein